MRSRLFFLLLILVFAGLIFYFYPIVKDKFFDGIGEKTIIINEPAEDAAPLPEESEEAGILEDTGKIQEEQEVLKDEGKIFQEITAKDCDSECENFSGVELNYCLEVCGLKIITEPISGCGDLNGLQKDYCLKDLGISKKDPPICDGISDVNVKNTCKNRILEEILDESTDAEPLPE